MGFLKPQMWVKVLFIFISAQKPKVKKNFFWSFYINYLNSLVFSKLPICNAIKIIFKSLPNIYKKKEKKRKSIKIYSYFLSQILGIIYVSAFALFI